MTFFRHEYYGNPVSAYCLASAAFLAIVGGFLALRRIVERTRPSLASDLLDQVRSWELVIVAADLATHSLDLPARLEHALHVVTVLVVAWRAIGLLSALAASAVRRTILSDPSDAENYSTAQTATWFAKAIIWIAAVMFTLSNLGYNVSSMLAGLGIGGVAVALGAQAVLGDFFAAIAIFLDKPFVAGDAIKVGDAVGTVEHIGIKTTRVRALSGELLVFPNSMIASSRIQNFKQQRERRVAFNFAVPLGTPAETLKKIPAQLKAVVEKLPDVRFDRAHLSQYQESGLQFEAVYWVESADYTLFMDRQQAVLVGLLESLRADGIALAQPTTVMIPGGPAA